MTTPYLILAGPGSPYSHKVRAVMRYRHIPHVWRVPMGSFAGGGGAALGGSQKGVVPVVLFPDGSEHVDSSPLVYELEDSFAGRSVIPPDPGLRLLMNLIDDWADEWLPLPMFYLRWTDDRVWCSRRQMFGWLGAIPEHELSQSAQGFLDRQVGQLGPLAALPREQMVGAYERVLDVLERHLEESLWLFGSRPSLADFAIYGQLGQYAVDPTACALMKARAVRVYQWTHIADDASGIDGDWRGADAPPYAGVVALLRLSAETALPMMAALLGRFREQPEVLARSLNGMAYRAKCLLWRRAELAALDGASRERVRAVLEATGCWEFLQAEAGDPKPPPFATG